MRCATVVVTCPSIVTVVSFSMRHASFVDHNLPMFVGVTNLRNGEEH